MNTWMRNYLIFCHVAVPMVFLASACFSYRHPGFLSWEIIVALAIAGLPLILPLLAYYVRGIGKDGVMLNNVFEGSVAAVAATPEVKPDATTSKLSKYSKPARKVMRTLWRFQREQFNDDISQRWAFGVHPLALDYPQFQNGVCELRFDGLIQNDGRGMVFLTDKGIDFCRDNERELTEGGDVWDKFGPV